MSTSLCPICVVEKFVDVQTTTGKPELTPSGFVQTIRSERMPLAAWMALTTRVGARVVHCYCPQCGVVFFHPDLNEQPGAPTPLDVPPA